MWRSGCCFFRLCVHTAHHDPVVSAIEQFRPFFRHLKKGLVVMLSRKKSDVCLLSTCFSFFTSCILMLYTPANNCLYAFVSFSHVHQRTQKGLLCFASSLLHSCAFDFHPVRVSSVSSTTPYVKQKVHRKRKPDSETSEKSCKNRTRVTRFLNTTTD